MRTLRKIGIALAAATAIAGAAIGSSAPAMAYHHHWHGGWHHGGWGPGFGIGFAFGAAPRYYYGGPYAYAYGDCYVRRTVRINRWGERIVRRVRVCN